MTPGGDRTRRALAALLAAACVGCATPESPAPRIEAAIARAEGFLERRGDRLDPLMTYVLVRLERRYGLTWTASQRATVLAAAPASPQLQLFARLVDARARPAAEALATIANSSDRLILSGLYCRELGPSAAADLETFARKPGPDPAHGALALQWSIENGCLTAEAAAPLRRLFVDRLAIEAGKAPASDVGIESMAMLDYLGAGDRIDASWLAAILAAQHSDGAGESGHPIRRTTTRPLWPSGSSWRARGGRARTSPGLHADGVIELPRGCGLATEVAHDGRGMRRGFLAAARRASFARCEQSRATAHRERDQAGPPQ